MITPSIVTRGDVVAEAHDVAARSAARSGIAVREFAALEDIERATALFNIVWPSPNGTDAMPSNLLRALAHAGNYVAGAFHRDELVGAIVGFLGLHERELVLHSHMLGVLPDARSRNVGWTLKQHQRAWALERGIAKVVWTFDPLVRRNAYFNLAKLGAIGARYSVNFYGEMADGINARDETDRLLVSWDVAGERARSAAAGVPVEANGEAAPVALEVGPDNEPVLRDVTAPSILCQVPDDVVALRAADPELAARWRKALRATLGRAVQSGRVAAGMSKSGWYLVAADRAGASPQAPSASAIDEES